MHQRHLLNQYLDWLSSPNSSRGCWGGLRGLTQGQSNCPGTRASSWRRLLDLPIHPPKNSDNLGSSSLHKQKKERKLETGDFILRLFPSEYCNYHIRNEKFGKPDQHRRDWGRLRPHLKIQWSHFPAKLQFSNLNTMWRQLPCVRVKHSIKSKSGWNLRRQPNFSSQTHTVAH